MSRPADLPEHSPPASDATVVTAQAIQVLGGLLPLDAALRAAAATASSRRLALALERVADRISQGAPLDVALSDPFLRFPPALRTALVLAAQQGRLPETLAQWTEQQQLSDDLRRATRGAVLYPLLVVLASLIIVLSFALTLQGHLKIYEEFSLRVPWTARSALWLSTASPWLLLCLVGSIVIAILARVLLGSSRWNTLLSSVPLVGSMWWWSALARLFRWLGVLVEARLPLPEALRLAGGLAGDFRLAIASGELASCVERGESLSQALADKTPWPATAAVLVHWGEQTGTLVNSLQSVAELCDSRARLRTYWTRVSLPPVAFLAVGFTVLFTYTVLLLPVVALISMFG